MMDRKRKMDTDDDPDYPTQEEYFSAYDKLDVHRLMLEDHPRTSIYRDVIQYYANDIQGKVVMDVGSGTGILSLFAATIGKARKVYAVEASNMVYYLRQIVEDNGLGHIIQVLHKNVEGITNDDIPEGMHSVDVIVSEWMGFGLFHEGMFDSVIYARDHWLRKDAGSLMLPSHAKIYAAPCSLDSYKKQKIDYWDQVWGFNLSCLKQRAHQELFTQGTLIEVIPPSDLICGIQGVREVKGFDLYQCSVSDISDISSPPLDFGPTLTESAFAGITMWFDVWFFKQNDPHLVDQASEIHPNLVLSTSPFHPPTHWKQVSILLGDFIPVAGGSPIYGITLRIGKDPNNPRLSVFQIGT